MATSLTNDVKQTAALTESAMSHYLEYINHDGTSYDGVFKNATRVEKGFTVIAPATVSRDTLKGVGIKADLVSARNGDVRGYRQLAIPDAALPKEMLGHILFLEKIEKSDLPKEVVGSCLIHGVFKTAHGSINMPVPHDFSRNKLAASLGLDGSKLKRNNGSHVSYIEIPASEIERVAGLKASVQDSASLEETKTDPYPEARSSVNKDPSIPKVRQGRSYVELKAPSPEESARRSEVARKFVEKIREQKSGYEEPIVPQSKPSVGGPSKISPRL